MENVRRVAEEYGIPCSTIFDHSSGKVLLGAKAVPGFQWRIGTQMIFGLAYL